jgi:hypothetical protein
MVPICVSVSVSCETKQVVGSLSRVRLIGKVRLAFTLFIYLLNLTIRERKTMQVSKGNREELII